MYCVMWLTACSHTPLPVSNVTYSAVCRTQLAALDAAPRFPLQPMDGFHQNQTCIARLACANQTQFEQPKWLEHVVQQFIEPYTYQTKRWQTVVLGCQQYSVWNPARDWLCQRDMARYHIFTDLDAALRVTGCGTDADWQRLAGYIRTCIQAGDYPPLLTQYIQNRVITYRTQVRNACLVDGF